MPSGYPSATTTLSPPRLNGCVKGRRGSWSPKFVRYFGNSSGLSVQGKPKFLPITERQVAHQKRAGADSLMRYLAWAKEDRLLCGFTLGLFPPTSLMKEEGPVLDHVEPGADEHADAAVLAPVHLPHADIKVIGDYEKKLSVIRRSGTSTTTSAS